MIKKTLFLTFSLLFISSLNAFDSQLIDNYKNIPLEEKIGQMLLVGFNGDTINDEILSYIKDYHIGGVILFNKSITKNRLPNITNPETLKSLNADLQKNSKIKLFIAIDQEGGYVARLNEKNGFYKTKTALEMGKNQDPKQTYLESKKIAQTLKAYGFNLNFAPVVDVNVNKENPVIGKFERSFSEDYEIVTKHALSYIEAHYNEKIIPVIKHFPGHGSSTKDSHKDFVDITNTYKDYELLPYERIISQNYQGGILTAHVVNKNIDNKYPASLSKIFITQILRNKLNFKGVIFSDDIKMKAIEDHWSLEETLVQSINAGTDVIIYGNNLGEYNPNFVKNATEIIIKNVKSGRITEDRINESYQRIIKLKKAMLYG